MGRLKRSETQGGQKFRVVCRPVTNMQQRTWTERQSPADVMWSLCLLQKEDTVAENEQAGIEEDKNK